MRATVLKEKAWAWNRGSEFAVERALVALQEMHAAAVAADATADKSLQAQAHTALGRLYLLAALNGDMDIKDPWQKAADAYRRADALHLELNDVLNMLREAHLIAQCLFVTNDFTESARVAARGAAYARLLSYQDDQKQFRMLLSLAANLTAYATLVVGADPATVPDHRLLRAMGVDETFSSVVRDAVAQQVIRSMDDVYLYPPEERWKFIWEISQQHAEEL
jgi:hypothetical protein